MSSQILARLRLVSVGVRVPAQTASPRRQGGVRKYTAVLIAVGGSLLVFVLNGSAAPPPSRGPFTYAQAVARGIPTIAWPAGFSLALCQPDPLWKGFATPQQAQDAIAGAADAPTCVADPKKALYGPPAISAMSSAPMPASGSGCGGSGANNRYSGAETISRYEGGRATIEVGDPDVSHTPALDHWAVSRVLAFTPAFNWIEIGWEERGIDYWTTPAVYTYKNPGCQWVNWPQFPLTVGSYYIFRVRDQGNTSAYAEIYWGTSWALVDYNPSMLCDYSYGTNNCIIEEYMEAFAAGTAPWPILNAPVDGGGVNFKDTMLRTSPSTWAFWNNSLYPSTTRANSPYHLCVISAYWSFRAVNGLC